MLKNKRLGTEAEIDLAVGREAVRYGNEVEGNIPPPSNPNPFGLEGDGVQTASLYGAFSREFLKMMGKKGNEYLDRGMSKVSGGLTEPHTRDVIEGARERQTNPQLDEETKKTLSDVLSGGAESPPVMPEGASGSPTPTQQDGIPAVEIDPADVQRRYEAGGELEKRTSTRNLNIERHHQGAVMSGSRDIGNAQTADDVAQIFNAVADSIDEKHIVQSNKSIEGKVQTLEDVKRELAPLLGTREANQSTPMSATQLYAARSLIATMGEEVSVIANRIKNGDATPETLLSYQKQLKTLASFQQFLRGNVRETARALQQQNMIAKTLKGGSISDIDELLNVAHMTPEQVKQHATVMAASIAKDGPVKGALLGKLDRLNDGVALAAEYWKASLLSGPETHLVNMLSNAVYNVWENGIIRPAAAGWGKALQKTRFGSDTDRVRIGETMGAFYGGVRGLKDGIEIAARTLAKDESLYAVGTKSDTQGLMKDAAAKTAEGTVTGKALRGAANVASMPFRFLQAEDDLFKTVAYRQELTALSLRQAYAEGLTGKEAKTRAAELIANPSDDIHEAAITYAKNLTFTNNQAGGLMGAMGKAAKGLTAEYPALQFIAPYINTPVNLIQRAADMSILAAFNPRLYEEVAQGGAARDTALAKISIGASVTALVWYAYESGGITGNGPTNPDQRKVLEKTGWRPNSRYIDGEYVPYKRLDPFSAAIAGLVDTMDAAKYATSETDASDYLKAGVFGISSHMMDATFLKGVSDTFKVVHGDMDGAAYFSNIASGFLPLSGAMKGISKAVDPQQRRINDDKEFNTGFVNRMNQKFKQWFPGQSFSMRPSRYWDGSVVEPEMGRFTYAASPIKTSEDKGVTPSDEILIANAVPVPEPSPIVGIGRGAYAVHFSLLDLDHGDGMLYDRYFQRVGDRRREYLDQLAFDDDFKELSQGPDGEQRVLIKQALANARKQGWEDFLEEDLAPMVKADPEKLTDMAKILNVGQEEFLDLMMMTYEKPEELRTEGELRMQEKVRPGRGGYEKAIPLPTTKKIKQDKPFEVGF